MPKMYNDETYTSRDTRTSRERAIQYARDNLIGALMAKRRSPMAREQELRTVRQDVSVKNPRSIFQRGQTAREQELRRESSNRNILDPRSVMQRNFKASEQEMRQNRSTSGTKNSSALFVEKARTKRK